jgi:hypothetical protein
MENTAAIPADVTPIDIFSTSRSPIPSPDNTPPIVDALQHVLLNVLNIPANDPVHSAFKQFWIFTLKDLLHINAPRDLSFPYSVPSPSGSISSDSNQARVPPMLIRNIELLQAWHHENFDERDYHWFLLTHDDFMDWKQLHIYN